GDPVSCTTRRAYLAGGDSRRAAGLTSGRPTAVVTDLALLDFEPQTKHMRLRQVQPGVSVADVQAATGFPLLLGEDLTELPEPSATELQMLRELSEGGPGGAE